MRHTAAVELAIDGDEDGDGEALGVDGDSGEPL